METLNSNQYMAMMDSFNKTQSSQNKKTTDQLHKDIDSCKKQKECIIAKMIQFFQNSYDMSECIPKELAEVFNTNTVLNTSLHGQGKVTQPAVRAKKQIEKIVEDWINNL